MKILKLIERSLVNWSVEAHGFESFIEIFELVMKLPEHFERLNEQWLKL